MRPCTNPTSDDSKARYFNTVNCRSMNSDPLSPDQPDRLKVTATLKLHPKDQQKLEQIASRMSMEKSISSVSWTAKEAEPMME
jgi:putative Mg2+ transporter-C (MgtC) family protein